MRKQLQLLLLFCFSILCINAQHIPEKLFTDQNGVYGFQNVTTVSDDHIGALGIIHGHGFYNSTFTLAMFDRNFGLKWAKGYAKNTICAFQMNSLLELSDKGIIAVGYVQDSVTSLIRSIILRTDSMGNILFAHELIDTLSNNEIEPMGILGNTDSTFILFSHLWFDGSVAVSKIDYAGNVLQSRDYRSFFSSHTADYATALRRANGNYVLILTDDYLLANQLVYLEFDPDLNLVNHNSYYTNAVNFCYDIAENPADQSLILVVWLSSTPNLKPLLIKLDATGNPVWSEAINASLSYTGIESVLIKNNNYYFSGTNSYAIDYIPFVLVTDSSGTILNSETYKHVGQQTVFNRMIDMQDSMMIVVSGRLNSNVGPGYIVIDSTLHSPCSSDDITFTASPFPITTTTDIYIDSVPLEFVDVTAQYQSVSYNLTESGYCVSSSISSIDSDEKNILLSTNGNSLIIELTDQTGFHSILIYNSSGQLLRILQSDSEKIITDVSSFANGIYIVKAVGTEIIITGKILLGIKTY